MPFISVGKSIEPPIKGLQGLRTWKDVDKVFVNGIKINDCIELDTEKGYVIRYVRKDTAYVQDLQGDFIRETVFGKVTFTWSSN